MRVEAWQLAPLLLSVLMVASCATTVPMPPAPAPAVTALPMWPPRVLPLAQTTDIIVRPAERQHVLSQQASWVSAALPAARPPRANAPLPEASRQPAEAAGMPQSALPAVTVPANPEIPAATVRFRFDSDRIDPPAAASLDQFARSHAGSASPTAVLATGHTDAIGPADYNRELSLRRAVAVQRYLAQQGVAAAAEGRGAADPAAPNTTGAGRARNRRVDLTLKASR